MPRGEDALDAAPPRDDGLPDVIPADAAPDVIPADAAPDASAADAPPDASATDAPPDVIPTDAAPDVIPTDAAPDASPADAAPDASPADAAPADAPIDAGRPCVRDIDCLGPALCGPAGVCVPLSCTPGRATCLDATRLEVCDARGSATAVTACPVGCADGACSRCPSSTTACAGRCVDPSSDPSHCGACGRACASGQACEGGACVDPCASPRVRCGSLCVDPQTDAAHCGGCGRACAAGQTCVAGACVAPCSAPSTRCGAACVNPQTDAAHCGGCSRACAAGQTCVAGACATPSTCAAPLVMCGAGCSDTQLDTANCGACGRACSAGAACNQGVCGPLLSETFQILSLDTSSACRTIEHERLTGDDRGGIAVSASNVFYTGDDATMRAALSDLSGAAAVGARHDGLFSDLANGEVYVLLNADGVQPQGPSLSAPFTASLLGVLDGASGALSTRRIRLSSTITFANSAGVFSGRGKAYFFTGAVAGGGSWVQVLLPSGAVTTLRAGVPTFARVACESWAVWGVGEYFGSEPYAVYAETTSRLVRYRIRDGMVAPLVTFPGPAGSMCSFSMAPGRGRWYFHYEGFGFAGGGAGETLGYCAASVNAAVECGAPLAPCGVACANLQADVRNCGACGHVCGASMVCAGGACACPSGQTVCGATCVDTATDVAHCGACGAACAAGQLCAAGRCGCAAALTACGAACVDLQSSRSNCGACGRACAATELCVRGACGPPPLYHGWACPIAGCSTAGYDATAPTNQGGVYPYNTGDSNACRAWKLAATVCNTTPTAYTDMTNWRCPSAGGFTDPAFGSFCAVTNQFVCSTCPDACNASCLYTPLSLRDCLGTERVQN